MYTTRQSEGDLKKFRRKMNYNLEFCTQAKYQK